MTPTAETDRARFEERVRTLAAFGHRGSATARERQAAEYLVTELTAAGLRPALEPFCGSGSMGARLLVPVLIAAAGVGLAWHWPAATAALALLALAGLVSEQMTGRSWLTWFLTRRPSANVGAHLPAAGDARRRVVLCAHYDTQRAGLIWNRFTMTVVAPVLARMPGPLRTPLFPLTAGLVVQVLFGLAAVTWPAALPVGPIAVALLVGYGGAGLLLGEWAVRPYVPGASDNGTGVAAVLALAERWMADPVSGTELVVLLTGCEETGLLGATAWCARHRNELRQRPTTFLNVDSLGFGPPRFLGCEVPMAGWPVRHPPAMRRLAGEAAAAGGFADAGPHAVAGPTDGLAFLAHGVPGVTVVGFRGRGVMEYYHQPGDTVEHTDFAAAWDGVRLAWAVLRRLAEESAAPG